MKPVCVIPTRSHWCLNLTKSESFQMCRLCPSGNRLSNMDAPIAAPPPRNRHDCMLGRYTDEQWLALLVRSIREETIDGLKFPRFPPDELQSQFVGSSNEHALNEAFYFYRFFKETSAKAGNVFGASKKALDFGTGWGRYLRFLWKDFGAENIVGLDIDPDVLEVARKNGVPGKLLRITPDGQMPWTTDPSMSQLPIRSSPSSREPSQEMGRGVQASDRARRNDWDYHRAAALSRVRGGPRRQAS